MDIYVMHRLYLASISPHVTSRRGWIKDKIDARDDMDDTQNNI